MILALAIVLWMALFYWVDRRVIKGVEKATIESESFIENCTVGIVFRNERHNIKACLEGLNNSIGVKGKLPVLMIDDHSDDGTAAFVESIADDLELLQITIIQANRNGKKNSLMELMPLIQTSWCYLTDADCKLEPTTLSELFSAAHRSKKKVVFAPVLLTYGNLFGRYQAYENLNTQSISEAFLAHGQPLMVNGANMLLHEDMYRKYIEAQRMEYIGGDDVFFAQSLTKDQFTYAFQNEASVKTKAMESMLAFWHQRMRWVAKTSGYNNLIHWLFSGLVVSINIVAIAVFIQWVFSCFELDTLFLFLFLKWLIEYTFHRRWFVKYGQRPKFFESILMSLLYPFYTLALAISSLLPLSFEWKGRTVRSGKQSATV